MKWRTMEIGGVWHSRKISRGRKRGWVFDVSETELRRTSDGAPVRRWYVTGEHRSGNVVNTAWPKVGLYFPSEEAAQAWAEELADKPVES